MRPYATLRMSIASILCAMLLMWAACAPKTTPSQEGSDETIAEGSTDTQATDGSNPEPPGQETTQPEPLPDASTEDTSPPEPRAEQGPDQAPPGDIQEPPGPEHTPGEPPTPDQAPPEPPAPDAPATDCSNNGGYCLTANETQCKTGYVAVNNPRGCQKPIPTCCLPVSPPNCGKEGDTITLNGTCCPGLTKGSAATPPGCVSTGQKFVCVKCGDGTCESTKGENSCSCPKDCPKTPNSCTSNGGVCTNTSMPCQPGYKVDATLACPSNMQQCCVKPGGDKCATVSCTPPVCAMNGTDCVVTSSRCDPTTGQCVSARKSYPGMVCDKNNACVPKSSSCTSHCDCTQGLLCANGCRAGFVPTYCCDNPGCPSGKACTFRSGQKGTCP